MYWKMIFFLSHLTQFVTNSVTRALICVNSWSVSKWRGLFDSVIRVVCYTSQPGHQSAVKQSTSSLSSTRRDSNTHKHQDVSSPATLVNSRVAMYRLMQKSRSRSHDVMITWQTALLFLVAGPKRHSNFGRFPVSIYALNGSECDKSCTFKWSWLLI